MESASAIRSFHCAIGTVANVNSLMEKPTVIPMCKAGFNSPTVGGRLILSPMARKGMFLKCVKASESTVAATSDVSSDSGSQENSEKKNLRSATFPNGFEALVLEVCDETDVAELKLKIGDFEMNLRRNIGVTKNQPLVSTLTPPPVPSKPMVDSAPAPAPAPAVPSKSSKETNSPFKNVSFAKSSKLAALEASGANGYVLVSSPTVGSFRRGRTLKGKKQPPICKEGDVIKEGQVIGFLDQFGSELPVKSDVAGEVLKLLYNDGEAVGYGDPLIAVLPSFHGIK
ncbi:Biotin/lipoyl attachment [Macleaya cordata]|uniref:Biotin/lipoyl attachment n=1 Tax=Macleaya cordata TaxID=56857 RepID=A0A200QBF2_MACCD|nr:Biotin/lipoyl attachment [Macleaya cordata]